MIQRLQQDLFTASLPAWCLSTDDPATFGTKARPKASALTKAYIDPNPKNLLWALVFDIDRPEAAVAWEDAGQPPPNWVTQNPRNGHAHLGYALLAPVARSAAAREAPQRLLARIQHGMTLGLDADRAYTHRLTKTPEHPRWRTSYVRSTPYELGELRDYLGDRLPLRIARGEAVGEGRNVTLFDGLRRWAYRARLGYDNRAAWDEACRRYAQSLNTFAAPLGVREVNQVAKSVAAWTWTNISPEGFAAIQAERQRRMVNKRQELVLDRQGRLLNL